MTYFVAYAMNSDLFEECDTKEEALSECFSYFNVQGDNAAQTYILEIGSDDLVKAAWMHLGGLEVDQTDEFVGEDVDSL